jgi:hypothetical protein
MERDSEESGLGGLHFKEGMVNKTSDQLVFQSRVSSQQETIVLAEAKFCRRGVKGSMLGPIPKDLSWKWPGCIDNRFSPLEMDINTIHHLDNNKYSKSVFIIKSTTACD